MGTVMGVNTLPIPRERIHEKCLISAKSSSIQNLKVQCNHHVLRVKMPNNRSSLRYTSSANYHFLSVDIVASWNSENRVSLAWFRIFVILRDITWISKQYARSSSRPPQRDEHLIGGRQSIKIGARHGQAYSYKASSKSRRYAPTWPNKETARHEWLKPESRYYSELPTV